MRNSDRSSSRTSPAASLPAGFPGVSSFQLLCTHPVNPDVLTLPLDLAEVLAESYSSGKL